MRRSGAALVDGCPFPIDKLIVSINLIEKPLQFFSFDRLFIGTYIFPGPLTLAGERLQVTLLSWR